MAILMCNESIAMTHTSAHKGARNNVDGMMGGANMVSMNIFSQATGFRMTNHAMERSQQRCIPPLIIHWLCQYGSRRRSRNGTIICYFDKKSIRMIASDAGNIIVRRLSGLMDAYLVITGKEIITVGHRYKRIKSP